MPLTTPSCAFILFLSYYFASFIYIEFADIFIPLWNETKSYLTRMFYIHSKRAKRYCFPSHSSIRSFTRNLFNFLTQKSTALRRWRERRKEKIKKIFEDKCCNFFFTLKQFWIFTNNWFRPTNFAFDFDWSFTFFTQINYILNLFTSSHASLNTAWDLFK